MKIKYYGTGGGAGIPEILCSCPVCEEARRTGGKNVRSRSQAVLDGIISIDYPVDTFMHCAVGGLNMRNIHNILITHAHHDHFLPADLFSRPQGMTESLNIWVGWRESNSVTVWLAAFSHRFCTHF